MKNLHWSIHASDKVVKNYEATKEMTKAIKKTFGNQDEE